MEKAQHHEESRIMTTWLGDLAIQLISSGISSAITGAVGIAFIHAKFSDEEKSNGEAELISEICVADSCHGFTSIEKGPRKIPCSPRDVVKASAKIFRTTLDQSGRSNNEIEVSSVHKSHSTTASASLPQPYSTLTSNSSSKRAVLPIPQSVSPRSSLKIYSGFAEHSATDDQTQELTSAPRLVPHQKDSKHSNRVYAKGGHVAPVVR